MIINIQFPGNFLTSWVTIRFPRRTFLCGISWPSSGSYSSILTQQPSSQRVHLPWQWDSTWAHHTPELKMSKNSFLNVSSQWAVEHALWPEVWNHYFGNLFSPLDRECIGSLKSGNMNSWKWCWSLVWRFVWLSTIHRLKHL